MTRTTIYKGIYFAMFGGAAVIALGILAYFRFSPVALGAVFIGLLIPGRILGFFWRDLLRGLRLLNERKYAESKRYSEQFLTYVRKEPWIKNLIWFGSSTYSRDPEVLALNNLAAAEISLGELTSARSHLERAIAMDPLCALLFYNMSALFTALGDPAEAERYYAQAVHLGYSRHGISDKIVLASQTRFANRSGR